MNPEPDSDIPSQPHIFDRNSGSESSTRFANWREALLALMESRISLIRLESKDAAGNLARRLVLWITIGICAFFTWALILTGGISLLAEKTHYPWYAITLVCAAAHLLAALILASLAKKPSPPAFPVSRSELQKDREWILKL
jgi:hypothetical protein